MHMRATSLALLFVAVAAWAQAGLAHNIRYELRRTARPFQARRHLQSSNSTSAVADTTNSSSIPDSGSSTPACTSCGSGCCNCSDAASCSTQDTCQWVIDNSTGQCASTVIGGSAATNGSNTTSDSSAAPNTSSDAAATVSCTPVFGMSVGAAATEWWPFSLKQFANGTAQSYMPITSPQETNQTNSTLGTYGADVTILQSDPVPWHIQLSSIPAVLEAGQNYTLKYTARSSVSAALQVAIVKVEDCNCNWQVFYLSQPHTTTQFNTYTAINLSPPTTASYLLNFDLAQAPSGAVFSFDDIMVCKQATSLGSTFVAAASENFETMEPNYIYQVLEEGDADVDMQSAAAAYTGQYGAAILITNTGTAPWHIQLAGQALALSSAKSYTVQLALKLTNADDADDSSKTVLVTWVDSVSYVPASVNTLQPNSTYRVFSLPPMSPPSDGLYYMTVDMGLVQQDATVYVDDIQVFGV